MFRMKVSPFHFSCVCGTQTKQQHSKKSTRRWSKEEGKNVNWRIIREMWCLWDVFISAHGFNVCVYMCFLFGREMLLSLSRQHKTVTCAAHIQVICSEIYGFFLLRWKHEPHVIVLHYYYFVGMAKFWLFLMKKRALNTLIHSVFVNAFNAK